MTIVRPLFAFDPIHPYYTGIQKLHLPHSLEKFRKQCEDTRLKCDMLTWLNCKDVLKELPEREIAQFFLILEKIQLSRYTEQTIAFALDEAHQFISSTTEGKDQCLTSTRDLLSNEYKRV